MPDFMAKVGNGMLKVTVTLDVTVTTTIRMPATLYLTVSANTADNVRTLRAYRLLHSWDESQATWNVYATDSSWGAAEGPPPASGHLPQIRSRTIVFGGGETDAASSESGAVSVPVCPAGGKVQGDSRSSL